MTEKVRSWNIPGEFAGQYRRSPFVTRSGGEIAMTHLKYINASTSRSDNTAPESGAPSLRFPGSVRDVLSRPDPRVMSSDDLVRSIDQTLDRMQDALSALSGDVAGSFKLEDFRARGGAGGPNSAA
jgi:hypothetical protein